MAIGLVFERKEISVSDQNVDLQAIRNYILKEFLPGEDPDKLTPTTPLLSSGVLDSLATLKLVSFLEQQFAINVAAHEADEENFNTLDAISALVRSKK